MAEIFTPASSSQRRRSSMTHDGTPLIPTANNDGVPAICRICRGEATETEPLFYPCKCSGSIKFVHQECLMEWLSHSQKKYCELCKTSFRFTKLYAPDMPQSLPVHVFIKHMAKYLFRNTLVWLRAVLAISIWVCWLPLFMRAVWSFMFWISDEGLGSSLLSRRDDKTSWEDLLFSLIVGQCPANPLVQNSTTSITQAAAFVKSLPSIEHHFPKYAFNTMRYDPNLANQTELGALYASNRQFDAPPASLLSNVTFLRSLTQSPRMNRAVISILEGQLITVLVIICFILIILVRDYVVQQQPELNMRAAFNENGEEVDAAFDAVNAHHHQDQRENQDHAADGANHDDNQQQQQLRGTHAAHDPNFTNHLEVERQEAINQPSTMPLQPDTNLPEEHDGRTLHAMEYMRIYRRANGDNREILRIIENEGLQNRLQFWAESTRRIIANNENNEHQAVEGQLDDETGSDVQNLADNSLAYESQARESFRANSDYVNDENDNYASPRLNDPSTAAPNVNRSGQRPRSISDGSLRSHSIHHLANNSWTFEGLTAGEERSDQWPQHHSDVSASSNTDTFNDQRGNNDESDLSGSVESSQRPLNRIVQRPLPEQEADGHSHAEQDATTNQPPEPILTPRQDNALEAENGNGHVGLVDRVANFMWGDLPQLDEDLLIHNEEHEADEDAWIDIPDDEVDADQPLAAAAADAMQAEGVGFDQEAIDDMEDFEGVMELVGMRGPIAGLFQNAIFCSVLVSVTIFACIFVPYNLGRITVWLMASPMRFVRMIVEISKLVQDAFIMACAFVAWCSIICVELFALILPTSLLSHILVVRKASWGLWFSAGARIFDYLFMDFPMSATEIQNFSAISHAALLSIKEHVAQLFATLREGCGMVYANGISMPGQRHLQVLMSEIAGSLWRLIASFSVLLSPDAWVINLGDIKTVDEVDPQLAHWSGTDRFWAIMAGYLAVFTVAAMYMRRSSPFSTGQFMRAWEMGIIDTLHQASGIMKVILIISIEMLVFPLYCGMLLDLALLPLFENATLLSRLIFTYDYPATSIFVHWFVGTGYMFHFALFVSMCRKIMRPGVLYFIRDPDDPEFHPVRDVLERSLITQLRKILFSAFVYGALVIVCLGGVVWGLSFAIPSVLPIHYSSNEPVLEFPVDLLFYNFLMPLAVKFFKPGDGIHAMYTWWFRRCARALRLTSFLFGDRRVDEEGTLQLPDDSKNDANILSKLLLGVDKSNNCVVKSWREAIVADVDIESDNLEVSAVRARKEHLVGSKQLVMNGQFVRAPASDRVKIAKDRKVFVAVDEDNKRLDGKEDDDLYASEKFRNVYVPPSFRSRIFLFILFIWIFAAFTGVSLTIVPLVIGRMIFKALIPDYVRTNDVYAFSIGIYLLGAASYLVIHSTSVLDRLRELMNSAFEEMAGHQVQNRIVWVGIRGCQLLYTYFFLVIVLPISSAMLVELYIAIPLHTYMNPPVASSFEAARTENVVRSQHTVRLTQAWTLGLLYVKLGSRMITTLLPNTRIAVAARTVLRRGWQRPDVRVFTRAFVVPGLTLALLASIGPPIAAKYLIKYEVLEFLPSTGDTPENRAKLAIFYRYSYPGMAGLVIAMRNAMVLAKVFKRWTAGVRDEAYLIGERLHNFGAATSGARKGKSTWRTGANRL